jgi:hypothetical protein
VSGCVSSSASASARHSRDPAVRAGMSTLAAADGDVVAAGIGRLAADLASGEWDGRYGHLRRMDELDLGYRLVVATRA